MSRHDTVNQLIEHLDGEAENLERLHRGMEQSRSAWLALRPGDLDTAVRDLQATADRSLRMEEQRRTLLADLENQLGLPRATVGRVCRKLPGALAERLLSVAHRASTAAAALRRETGMGTRLLDFARHSQESMIHSVTRLADRRARGYDRNANAVDQPAAAGSFVDGRL